MKEKEIKNVKICDVNNMGNGYFFYDKPVFVSHALKDEVVDCVITQENKKYAQADIKNIISPSNLRIKECCPFYEVCGGCSFLHTTIENENEIKENYVRNLFKDYKVNKIISLNEYNYRNKVTLHVKNGRLGFYKEKTHDIVEFDKCYLLDGDINVLINELRKMDLLNVDEIMIRKSYYEDSLMLDIKGKIDKKYLSLLSNFKVSSIYVNDKKVMGKDYLTESIGDYRYSISPKSFFQVNYHMIKVLYDLIYDNCCGDKLLDLYCGTGTIGIYLSKKFNSIYGVEIVSDAIDNANINKELNGIKNAKFLCLDAKDIDCYNFDVIVVDPPRSGLSSSLIEKMEVINPKKIIYVSCNPNTLKRDISLFKNYRVVEINVLNMFFRTHHMETVCILEKM